MIRMLLPVVAVLLAAGTASSAAAVPTDPGTRRVVYVPRCAGSEVVPASSPRRGCPDYRVPDAGVPGLGSTPGTGCRQALPGDYALTPPEPTVLRHGSRAGRTFSATPRQPDKSRSCSGVVPAGRVSPLRP